MGPMKMSEAWSYIGFMAGMIAVHLTVRAVHVPYLSGQRIPTLIAGLALGVALGYVLDKAANGPKTPPPPV